MRFDAVVSYHTDPHTCGTARFNAMLAERLGVPLTRLLRKWICPLVSLRFDEIVADGVRVDADRCGEYGLILHDWQDVFAPLVAGASVVYAANPALARTARALNPHVIDIWCPSTIVCPHPEQAARSILTFGMLHKFDAARYRRLKDLLDAGGTPYELLVSYSVHHGKPADERHLIEQFEDVFGSSYHDAGLARVTILGQLSDTALIRELPRVVAVAVFYDPAVRANNTTAWLALEWGRCLITNLDADSPAAFVHGETVYDINQLTAWPTDKARVSQQARAVASAYSWERLLDTLQVSQQLENPALHGSL